MIRLSAIIAAFIIGAAAGLYSGWRIFSPTPATTPPAEIVTTVISGDPGTIINHDWSLEPDPITWRTSSTGVGEIETALPKSRIPEASAWMVKRNGILLQYHINWVGSEFTAIYGVSYYRRWGPLALGAGVTGGRKTAGLNAGALYWW